MAKDRNSTTGGVELRRGTKSPRLGEIEAKPRYRRQFHDPAFRKENEAIGSFGTVGAALGDPRPK